MRDMPPEPGDVFELRVSLRDIEPGIWRGLHVPAAVTLAELHGALQTAFGWQDYHLHAFDVGGIRFALPCEDDWMFVVDERATPLGAVARAGTTLVYHYDFGDDWLHDIAVESIGHDPQARISCTGGARACPPEDCGGPPGYERMLEALADPDHEDHEQMLEWIGPRFDAEAFDMSLVNRKLARPRKRAARSRAKSAR